MSSTLRTILVSALTSFVVSVAVFGALQAPFAGPAVPAGPTLDAKPFVPSTEDEANVTEAVAAAEPAVVSVIISKDLPVLEEYYEEFPFFDLRIPRYRQNGTQEQEVGGGTAFFVSEGGLLMTNKHVVDDEEATYTVFLNDGRKLEATVAARDPMNDIALLQVEGSGFPFLRLAEGDDLHLGQSVIAIGNALAEFRNTVSVGVISGLSRSIVAGSGRGQAEELNRIIQTDAAINEGNSGGPLLDLEGRVVGMNTAVAAGAMNIGFALPASDLRRALESYERYGRIVRPYVGVRYVPVTEEIRTERGLAQDHGVLVFTGTPEEPAVLPGSPAQKAGLREGDVILEADGQELGPDSPLADVIQRKMPGDTVTLRIARGGEETELRVTLEELPQDTE